MRKRNRTEITGARPAKYVSPAQRARKERGAAVLMLGEALDALPPDQIAAALGALIRDDPRYTAEQIEQLSNILGREAHERARQKG